MYFFVVYSYCGRICDWYLGLHRHYRHSGNVFKIKVGSSRKMSSLFLCFYSLQHVFLYAQTQKQQDDAIFLLICFKNIPLRL